MVKSKDQRGEYYWGEVRNYGSQYPSFNWPSVEMFLNLLYTYDVVSSHMTAKITPYGITRSGLNVLLMLSRSPSKACKQNEISKLLLFSRANITGLVDSLSRKGFVGRLNDPNDRRVNMIKILPKGEKILKDLLPGYYEHIHDICSVFSADQKKNFNESLTQLRARINEIKG